MLRIKNIIGYWPLRGDGHDESGNGHHMTGVDMAWSEDRGQLVPVFNGTSSHFYCAASPAFKLQYDSFTISLWAKTSTLKTSGDVGVFCGATTVINGGNRSYDIPFYYTGSRYLQIAASNIQNDSTWSNGVWNHWAWVNDKANNLGAEYFNGVRSASVGVWRESDPSGDLFFAIGASVLGAAYWYAGNQKDVMLVKDALTPSQISALAQGKRPFA